MPPNPNCTTDKTATRLRSMRADMPNDYATNLGFIPAVGDCSFGRGGLAVRL